MRKLAHDFLWFAMDRCGGRSHKCEPRAQKKAAQHEVINLFRKKLVTTRGFNIDPPADRQTSERRSVWMKISLQAADKVNR